MFFIPAILTRKGPLAIVWMAAHVLKKVTKHQILETDVAEIVESIQEEYVPTSLRTTGDLLIGVCNIHLRQTKYMLEDVVRHYDTVQLFVFANSNDMKHGRRQIRIDLNDARNEALLEEINLPEIMEFFDLNLPAEVPEFDERIIANRVRDITMQESPQLAVGDNNVPLVGSEPDRIVDDFGERMVENKVIPLADLFKTPTHVAPPAILLEPMDDQIPFHPVSPPMEDFPELPPPFDSTDPGPSNQDQETSMEDRRFKTKNASTGPLIQPRPGPDLILDDLTPTTIEIERKRKRRAPSVISGDEIQEIAPIPIRRPRLGGRGVVRPGNYNHLLFDRQVQIHIDEITSNGLTIKNIVPDIFFPETVPDSSEDLFSMPCRRLPTSLKKYWNTAIASTLPAPEDDYDDEFPAIEPINQQQIDDFGLLDEPIPPLPDIQNEPPQLPEDIFDFPMPEHLDEPHVTRPSYIQQPRFEEPFVDSFIPADISMIDSIFNTTIIEQINQAATEERILFTEVIGGMDTSRMTVACLFAKILESKCDGQIEIHQIPEYQYFTEIFVSKISNHRGSTSSFEI